jgi:glycosyltransferase involved in cell wall biosynthesis
MNNNYNLISAIISTYNRCESLRDTLDSLSLQELNDSFNYEVIVVDNNSKDRTKETVSNYIPKFSGRLRYLFEPRQGRSYALNTGIKEAKGEIIAFTDDDVIVDKKWALNLYLCLYGCGCDAVGGRILPLYPDNTPRWIRENKNILYGPIPLHDYGEDTKIYDTKDKRMLPFIGANQAFKKECLSEMGLFREDLGVGRGAMGEDTEFFRRLEKNNKRLYYCGQALVWHKVEKSRMSLKYIAQWCIQSGRYYAAKDINTARDNAILYFGIPRYLFRKIIGDITSFVRVSNIRSLLISWMTFFTHIGIILEHRRFFLEKKQKDLRS